ncbi:hypothetical protein [Syntrophus aciditrophicus]|nr:hypothetical protein [Syntrophus aciditrophicus]
MKKAASGLLFTGWRKTKGLREGGDFIATDPQTASAIIIPGRKIPLFGSRG